MFCKNLNEGVVVLNTSGINRSYMAKNLKSEEFINRVVDILSREFENNEVKLEKRDKNNFKISLDKYEVKMTKGLLDKLKSPYGIDKFILEEL
ncbi:hypothetical protein CLVI_20700 [Clostridium vincentii]|uniref:Uncharacterized protein n=2 Tax=Clostridium vincentii TaxID=52704 RepID=A0A2T0BDR5_9CLOT|nr:hypothetical protein CLVI_20700 [Clostridium vincentii]